MKHIMQVYRLVCINKYISFFRSEYVPSGKFGISSLIKCFGEIGYIQKIYRKTQNFFPTGKRNSFPVNVNTDYVISSAMLLQFPTSRMKIQVFLAKIVL